MQRSPFGLMIHLVQGYLHTNIRIPEIQRDATVWSLEQKQDLIDSLYNDFDIPKIYLRKDTAEPNIWWLIDGQQRLTTINEFLHDKFQLGDSSTIPEEIRGKKYNQLLPTHQGRITGKVLDCVIVECSDEEEEDMFTRLNNGTPLSAPEKRNAITGEVRDFVKSLAKHKFFKHRVNFTTKRFAHDAVCAQLVLLCMAEQPTDTKGKSLKRLYAERRSFPEKQQTGSRIKKALNLMCKIFTEKESYMKKYNVCSIFLFLQELSNRYAVANIKTNQWYKFFNDFEKDRIESARLSEDDSKFDQDLADYFLSCNNSPDSEQSLKVRHEILLKKFFLKFNNVEFKDSQRDFSESQKSAIYTLNNKRCQGVEGFVCPNSKKRLPFEDCEFDHIKEYNGGGPTTVSNGQVLCKPCHNYKTQIYRSEIRN